MNIVDSSALDIQLHEACANADVAEARRLVDLGADINKIIGPPGQLDYSINTATKAGSIPLVRFLLDHGATVNPTAMRDAAIRGNAQMLKLLLEPVKALLATAGMTMGWRRELASILKGAAERGQIEVVEALKVFRTRVDDFDKAIDAGLIAAAAAGDLSSVKRFLSLGASDTVNGMATAAEYDHFEVVDFFLQSYSYEPEDFTRPLISAAAHGNLPSVLLLVENGAYDGPYDEGVALIKAAKFCHIDIARFLLQRFNYTPTMLSRALLSAACTGDTELMELLIEEGAQGTEGLAPVMQKGHTQAIELLLERFTYPDSEISKALGVAMFVWLRLNMDAQSAKISKSRAQSQSIPESPDGYDVVKRLFEKGARLSDNYFCRLVEIMIIVRHKFLLEFVEKRAKYTVLEVLPDQYLVSLAIYHQQDAVAKALLNIDQSSAGKTNEVSDAGSTKALVSTTADTTKKDTTEPTPNPLMAAVMREDEAMCKILIGLGVKINDWCSYRPNKLPLSFYGFNKKTATPKDEKFEDLSFAFGKDKFDDNALTMAIRVQHKRIMHMLVENGADPWLNKEGTSVFDLAGEKGMLRDLIACLQKKFSARGFEVNKRETCGRRSLLHFAAAHGDVEVVNELIKQGASPNITDSQYQTPLHHAVKAANVEATKALLWAGASTEIRDLERSLCPDSLATVLLTETPVEDPLRTRRTELSYFIDEWVRNDMDQLDAVTIRNEARRAEEKARSSGGSWVPPPASEVLVDHFSDEDSVHWSEEEED